MAVHYRTYGFILKKTDRGEADQLFTIYTKDFGKLEILGKAIRKIKSKLRSGIELFYLSEIEFIQGKTYKTLTDAILIEKFQELRNNLDKLKIASQIAEVSDNLIDGQEKDEEIWELLSEVFNKLNNSKSEIIYYYFLWNILSALGYQINLYNCAVCQKKLLPQKLYFNTDEGGIICLSCFKEPKIGNEISPETIKILRVFIKKDWETLLKIKIENNYIKSLESISENYFSYHKQ